MNNCRHLIIVTMVWVRLAVELNAVVPFEPGEPIPAGGAGHYGIIDGRTSHVCGTAEVFGKGPYDLFVGLRALYPFTHFDAHHVPVYGKRMSINSPMSDGYVFQQGRDIYAISSSDKKVVLLAYDRQTMQFQYKASATLPNRISDITGFIASDQKLHAFYTRGNGAGYYPTPGSHDPEYRPFDGSGFWRGDMPADYLYYARWTSPDFKELEYNGPATPNDPEQGLLFGCSGTAIVKIGPGQLEHCLVAANRLGVFRSYLMGSSHDMPLGEAAFAVEDSEAKVMLRHPIVNPKPVPFPNPVSGYSDLIVSDSCRTWHYQLQALFGPHTPVYGKRRPVIAAGEKLLLGALPVISPGDINRDGKVDFISGNDAGELLFIENIGTPNAPDFTNPVELLVDGKYFRERGGYRGSIQGPGEANWGYTCPTLFDWDGDGKLDIVMNSIRGNIVVLLQINGQKNPPEFGTPLPLFNNSLDLHLSWRTQPGITTWGGNTVPCIIANDENNQLRMYYRMDNQNVKSGLVLRLNNGKAIQAHDQRYGGQFGRSKIVPTDWDNDGTVDLLIGTGRAMSIPGPRGIPDNLSGNERQASVLFLRNTGSNKEPIFSYPVRVVYNGSAIKLGVHSCSPAVVTFKGRKDLMVAEENGRIIYYPRDSLSWN
jgi:hypothetical protein